MPCFSQAPAPSPADEKQLLQDAVAQAGDTPLEFIRVAERHLSKFPNSSLRADIESALLKAAIDARDNRRTIYYGEKLLQRNDDPALLDRIARAYLASDEPASALRSLQFSQRLEKAADKAAPRGPGVSPAERQQEIDRTLARAFSLQARAWGNAGDLDKAIALARKSFELFPTGEAAREAARWELKAGRLQDALLHYADAFSILDPKVTEENRSHHRQVMGELYTNLHGSEKGLGDFILQAYDRTARLLRDREAALRAANPNRDLQDALQFRLSGLRGDSIRLADFAGKVQVVDFWATWCIPCRFTHPILEELKKKYGPRGVVFHSLNADEERALVGPFLEKEKWSDQVYFEDGLARFYRLTGIPTTLIFNKRGELSTRLSGYTPQGFQDLLASKIEEALRE